MNDLPKVTLYSTVGGSDKVYCLEIVAQGDGYVVNFANGRRGGTLQHGTKTSSPVPLAAAQKAYDKVYKEKTGKGYTLGEGEQAFSGTDNSGRVSGHLPQLLNPISREEMIALAHNPAYLFQEKHDGNRVTIRKTGGKVEAVNRKGLTIGFPKGVETEALTLGGDFILDGEMIDQCFYAFDCLKHPEAGDVRDRCVKDRYAWLQQVIFSLKGLADGDLTAIFLVEAAFTTKDKLALFERVEKQGREGVVAKLISAPYEIGRPNSGGNWLKFKFRHSATVIVSKVNSQRSVGMAVIGEKGETVEIGNVTIPANANIPNAGDLIEVSYRHANVGGSLIEPVYHALRTDIDQTECVIGQLKFKDA